MGRAGRCHMLYEIKMPLYARYGVAHAWLVDPLDQTLETYGLRNGEWAQVADYKAPDVVTAPPFEAAVFRLAELWS